MKKKALFIILLIIQLYVNYQNWFLKGQAWDRLELRVATVFSIFLTALLLLLIFNKNMFSFLMENDLFLKTWHEFNKNLGGKIAVVMLF